MFFNKKKKLVKIVPKIALIEAAWDENEKFAELGEYAEISLNVSKEHIQDMKKSTKLTLEELLKQEQMNYDTIRAVMDAHVHAYARDLLINIADRNTIDALFYE